VWRHLPLTDVHPSAQLAAQATECADLQGKFWEMHDLLLAHQDELTVRHLLRYAKDLGMEVARFRDDLRAGTGTERIAEDVESADLSGVSGTPTFFVNGLRHQGAYDIASLKMAVKLAQVRAGIGTVPAAEPVTG
jgi:protein-disulfide isomerase